MRHVFVATMTGTCVALSLLAGTSRGQRERSTEVRPTPRRPDGRINLSSVPGQKGHWIRTMGSRWSARMCTRRDPFYFLALTYCFNACLVVSAP